MGKKGGLRVFFLAPPKTLMALFVSPLLFWAPPSFA